jgi:ABC-type Zn uptake system ZnuABC Zn-binding protein ZnuA
MGDVHPFGNPHFFLDPMAGLRVARLIRDKLRELSPADHPYFQRRFDDFQQRLVSALVGPDLAARFHADKLARLIELDGLDPFLAERGERGDLGGWLGDARAMQGVAVVADHNIWPYFAHRFGLEVIGFLEPKPGVAPTTRHLAQLLNEMKARSVRLILATPYYDPRHAAFLAEKSGARVLPMANQVGARPEAANYLALIDYNVRQLREGCREPAK